MKKISAILLLAACVACGIGLHGNGEWFSSDGGTLIATGVYSDACTYTNHLEYTVTTEVFTNVVPGNDETRFPHSFMFNLNQPGGSVDHPMTKKWVTTTCIKREILRFEWHGKREVVFEETLWESNKTATLKQEWEW